MPGAVEHRRLHPVRQRLALDRHGARRPRRHAVGRLGRRVDYNVVDPRALRTYDEQSLRGKILHVDRNGHGLPGHPFCPARPTSTQVCTKLCAKGFRNPFRFPLRPRQPARWSATSAGTRRRRSTSTRAGPQLRLAVLRGPGHTPGYTRPQRVRARTTRSRAPRRHRARPTPTAPRRAAAARSWSARSYTGAPYPAELARHVVLRRLRRRAASSAYDITDGKISERCATSRRPASTASTSS